VQVLRHVKDLRESMAQGKGPRVLVPTMGALHAGHLALIDKAREIAGNRGRVLVSIFVNPIQFDRKDDLDGYPRGEQVDLKACEAAGVDLVFVPDPSEMYAVDHSVTVVESSLSTVLCGASRPGHFEGVCTVVLKLFLLSSCDAAVFGEKDFQQLAVIRRMVRDLNVPVEIIAHPTLRESDGLAMSSRNSRLSVQQRADAACLYRALCKAAEMEDVAAMLNHVRNEIEASGLARIDYLELVDAETLRPAASLSGPSILAVAVFYGEVRLIDHVTIMVS
jgi:pantoate--beta-alanine ligase